ncbi:XRE family transcriptional regulator [Acetobacter sicerae]|uniref:XRE family transcriptional regulator n=1 Tax=Acetobacter sicerae TaxID=85325 RepID=UPI00156B335E|nr:XRE family transcriptional regulator [Acetobacter sicerae]NHN92316.1 XRE family transcriptional regulator [Acetobacter sicerae]
MTEREVASVANESSFEDFLIEDGSLDDVDAIALKRVIAWQLADKMRADGMTKTAMAHSMSTSRTQVDRLLDPENTKVQLDTVQRAAKALSLRMSLRFDPIEEDACL